VLAVVCRVPLFLRFGRVWTRGADEPRYAQVARKCSSTTIGSRPHWATTLVGKASPPVLGRDDRFRLLGVSDWAARLPSAFSALLMIVAIYFVPAAFRPGSELDGALMTASCVAVIGFARAAATEYAASGQLYHRSVGVVRLV